jgi:hypothetical protein
MNEQGNKQWNKRTSERLHEPADESTNQCIHKETSAQINKTFE